MAVKLVELKPIKATKYWKCKSCGYKCMLSEYIIGLPFYCFNCDKELERYEVERAWRIKDE